MYGIYKEYKGAGGVVGRAPPPPYSLYIPYIFPKYVPYVFPCVFLIYGVKSRSGHDRSQSRGSISHVSGP